ncbi:MAG TPA: aldo/keto reductase [Thermoanaerobaculia bacterium]|nr:aldo/keto reductase [Thermoanaerobaculia bacterium]
MNLGGDLSVNRLGFGAMRVTGKGVWGPPRDVAEARRVLRRVVELGINLIDTAESYGPHVSEQLIGETLHPYPEGLVIATKGGLDRPGPSQWVSNARPERLREELDGSLRRLKLERIDLYQLHRIDSNVPEKEQFETLREFQREGKVRHLGLSEVNVAEIKRARKVFDVVSVQNRYSLADREWEKVLDYCEANGIGFIPWYPLQVGKLADAGGKLARIAKKYGATTAQIALAWLLKRSPVMLPIPGTGSVKHVEENAAAATIELSDEDFQSLA